MIAESNRRASMAMDKYVTSELERNLFAVKVVAANCEEMLYAVNF